MREKCFHNIKRELLCKTPFKLNGTVLWKHRDMKCFKCQKSFHLLSQVKRRHFMWFGSSDANGNGIRLENARPVSGSTFTNLPDFISSLQSPCGGWGPRSPLRDGGSVPGSLAPDSHSVCAHCHLVANVSVTLHRTGSSVASRTFLLTETSYWTVTQGVSGTTGGPQERCRWLLSVTVRHCRKRFIDTALPWRLLPLKAEPFLFCVTRGVTSCRNPVTLDGDPPSLVHFQAVTRGCLAVPPLLTSPQAVSFLLVQRCCHQLWGPYCLLHSHGEELTLSNLLLSLFCLDTCDRVDLGVLHRHGYNFPFLCLYVMWSYAGRVFICERRKVTSDSFHCLFYSHLPTSPSFPFV